MLDIKDSVAVITGGSGGIGLAADAHVHRRDGERVAQLVDALEAADDVGGVGRQARRREAA